MTEEYDKIKKAKADAAEEAELTVYACKILADKYQVEPYWFLKCFITEFEKLVKEYE